MEVRNHSLNTQKGEKDPPRTETSMGVGHVEELRQDFSVWSLGSLLVCLMGTWEALTSVVTQALVSGGAPCLFYN